MIARFEGEHAFLSNFWPWVDGRAVELWSLDFGWTTWPTAEHAFQSCKTVDLEDKAWIQEQATPGRAKRVGGGRIRRSFRDGEVVVVHTVQLRRDWEQVKASAMMEVLRAKFAPGSELLERLRATGDQLLVEGNSWGDRVWGATAQPAATIGPTDPRDWGPVEPGSDLRWVGRNLLGIQLMEIRGATMGPLDAAIGAEAGSRMARELSRAHVQGGVPEPVA